MADEIKVKHTPVQRNTKDVAVELTKLLSKRVALDSVEDIQDAYIKFYTLAEALNSMYPKQYKDYLPEELKKLVTEYY